MNIVEPIKNKIEIKNVEKVLKKNKRDLLLFIIGINTGLRISDILSLNVCDVKNKDYVDLIEQKTGKYKKFPLNIKIKNLLKTYIKDKPEEKPLFESIYNNRLERTYVYRVIKKACLKAGIKNKIGTHTLRKTFGYHHYKKFKDIALLQKIFNHNSPQITLRYIGIEQEEIDESYRKFIL